MKKGFSILFVARYASTVFGPVVDFHYCGKHLAKASVLNVGESPGNLFIWLLVFLNAMIF